MEIEKCSRCRRKPIEQVVVNGKLCMDCIAILEDALLPKLSWIIFRNAKLFEKGKTSRTKAFDTLLKTAYSRKAIYWNWKGEYYCDEKDNRYSLKFLTLYHIVR